VSLTTGTGHYGFSFQDTRNLNVYKRMLHCCEQINK
jgi:hypothetical protein